MKFAGVKYAYTEKHLIYVQMLASYKLIFKYVEDASYHKRGGCLVV